ncbi:hypothetical protein BGZ63DRAFT_404092 [Mariannaea sp. PMI_226]|nr:hypothetical protein BGZ63DRAFT_404092 [Mariannaea sp. PMI_226]
MPAANSKANYKTYEAQARMVRAIVAAHPEVKWNYKACYGSDMTDHALNHRFRRLRAQAVIIQAGREYGLDMKDLSTDDNALPKTQDAIDKHNIAKYFGQSTADGIQFQFRTIKKDAEQLRQVERSGGNVASCLSLGTASLGPCTPSKSISGRSFGSRSTGKRSRVTPASSFIKRSESDEEEDELADFSGMDETPSKRIKTTGSRTAQARTSSRKAATQANATIAAAAQAESSASPPEEISTPTAESLSAVYTDGASIFGNVEQRHPAYDTKPSTVMKDSGYDEFSHLGYTDSYYGSQDFDEGDGEI